MRRKELAKLEVPYKNGKEDIDDRFNSSIGAGVPYANGLAKQIFSDLDPASLGLPVFNNLAVQERILTSDYFYQCVSSIEMNLAEAKLHYFEWLEYTDKQNDRYADVIKIKNGQVCPEMPKSTKPMDDLPNAFEKLHVGGFFRAIGSAFDCLGATIVAVLGLSYPLRLADINNARGTMKNLTDDGSAGSVVQREFREFLEDAIHQSGPEDWFEWSTQYRNMFVHRGRRLVVSHFTNREVVLYGPTHQQIPRVNTIAHLAIQPDKSDIEAMIYNRTLILNEAAVTSLDGIFTSARDFIETVSKRLFEIWNERKANPSLILQPDSQWKRQSKRCSFHGYEPNAPKIDMDTIISHPTLMRRFRAASAFDSQRPLWNGTEWVEEKREP